MTSDDDSSTGKRSVPESGIEYRATIRFPQKDYEFMQRLIDDGEYTNITEIVREAVKRFRLEWRDGEAWRNSPNGPWMGMGPMPWMRMMGRGGYNSGYGRHSDDRDD